MPEKKHNQKPVDPPSLRSVTDKLYRTFIDSLPVAVLITDLNGYHLCVNQKASEMTGYSINELTKGIWMVAPEDNKAAVICEHALRDGTPAHDYETRLIRKDGSAIRVSLSWDPIFDATGKRIGLCTIFADITEKRQAEEAFAAANQRYRMMAENSADMFWEMDFEGSFTYVSPGISSLGYEPDEWVGHNLVEFLVPDEIPVFRERLTRDVRKPGPTLYESRILGRDGSEIWVEVMINLAVKDGKPVSMYGIARNITGRKNMIEALRESEQRYKSIVENSTAMIMLTGPDGVVTYASPATSRVTGYDPEDLVGTVAYPLHEDDAEWMRASFEQAMQGGSGTDVEYRIITKTGETRWVSHSWSPIIVDDHLQCVLSFVIDITERKRSEDALRDAHIELGKAYMLQQQFLNSVTHEVRTPLTAVKGYAEMLMEGIAGPVSSEQIGLLEKVLASSDHLLDVVDGVLQIARMRSGRITLYPTACHPAQIIEKCVMTVTPQAEKKGLPIHVRDLCEGCMGTYDRGKLTIILTNLLTNAVKFTEKGSIDVTVTCSSPGIEIVVLDTGMGMKDSEIAEIFDEFSQLEYPGKHKPTGFGIGLTIVASMVDAIGASLTVSSRKGVGTAFTLDVPMLQAD